MEARTGQRHEPLKRLSHETKRLSIDGVQVTLGALGSQPPHPTRVSLLTIPFSSQAQLAGVAACIIRREVSLVS